GDVERHLGVLNALLKGRDWFVGDALSYADLAVIGQLNALLYAEEARAALSALQDSDEITPWMQRLDRIAPK
ncbi:MAG: hypothetical protein F4220_06935, partial [Gammaproteobacteria bacterium]|nr:hypothetical protein [Gammaproteobacteria bacterium]